MIKRLLCLFGFHDWEARDINMGECGELEYALLKHASLMVRCFRKDGCYWECWRKCSKCGKEQPRGWQKDVYDVEAIGA